MLFPLHHRQALNKQFHKLYDNSKIIRQCRKLTKIVPHISDLKSNSLPHVSISVANLNQSTVKLSFLYLNNLFDELQMILLVQYLISLLLREGFQLQCLVGEKRHGQMKVVIPQL